MFMEKVFVKEILKSRGFPVSHIDKYINDSDIFIPEFKSFLDIISKSNSILIVGDYDVDGVVSTAILSFVLEKFFENSLSKERKIFVFIPNRFEHGYGLNKKNLKFIMENYLGKIDTLITVDNGISSYEEVKILKDKGLKVIIIDHHRVPEKVPVCDLIIHPKFFDLGYDYLCASGIVYKLSVFLLNWIKRSDILNKVFLFLSAMATIADVVPLLEDNRNLAKRLFKLLERQFIPLPILSLFNIATKKESLPSTMFDFSYIIIPLLNSPGRIDDPYLSFNFIKKSIYQVYYNTDENLLSLSEKLRSLNIKRQQLQDKIFKEVMEDIKKNELYKDNVIVPKYIENGFIEAGVIGIVASKIANIYKKPSFVFVKNGNILKGSCRSPIENLDITEKLGKISNLLLKWGGHRKAAGLELSAENFDNFKNSINSIVNEKFYFKIDLELPNFFFHKFVRYSDKIFDIMKPFGEKNELPTLKISNYLHQDFIDSKKIILNDSSYQNVDNTKNEDLFIKLVKVNEKYIVFDKMTDFVGKESSSYNSFISLKEVSSTKQTNFALVNLNFKGDYDQVFEKLISLFNSYRNFIVFFPSNLYQKFKQLIYKEHFFISNIKQLSEYIFLADENVFITNEDDLFVNSYLRGVVVFTIYEIEQFSEEDFLINSFDRNIIWVRITNFIEGGGNYE